MVAKTGMGFFNRLWVGITGYVVAEEEIVNSTEVIIEEIVEEIEVEYWTEGPTSKESSIENGKRIFVGINDFLKIF